MSGHTGASGGPADVVVDAGTGQVLAQDLVGDGELADLELALVVICVLEAGDALQAGGVTPVLLPLFDCPVVSGSVLDELAKRRDVALYPEAAGGRRWGLGGDDAGGGRRWSGVHGVFPWSG